MDDIQVILAYVVESITSALLKHVYGARVLLVTFDVK